ncbi:MAG: hypothetical protein M1838_000730 [Thelocarpon superellum]|nr:MAG: hypothetical protein M1838_000730 [Thelocarpon superellum]
MVFGDISEPGLLAVIWVLGGIATILTGFRLYVRYFKLGQLMWDDAFHMLAWSMLMVSAGLYTRAIPIIYKVTAITSGQTFFEADFLETQLPIYSNIQFATFTLFFSIVWSVKFAFLLFYRRFFLGLRNHLIAWWLVTSITILAFVSNMAIWLCACGSPMAYFSISACLSPESIDRARLQIQYGTSVDIITDAMIMAVPLAILWDLRVTTGQKLGLAGIFLLAVVVIVFAALRAVESTATFTPTSISSLEKADPISLTLWTALESSIAVIVSTLPSFRIYFLSASQRYADETPSVPFSGLSSSLQRYILQRKSVCRHCGKPKAPRAWFSSLPGFSQDSGKTLTSRYQGDQRRRSVRSERTVAEAGAGVGESTTELAHAKPRILMEMMPMEARSSAGEGEEEQRIGTAISTTGRSVSTTELPIQGARTSRTSTSVDMLPIQGNRGSILSGGGGAGGEDPIASPTSMTFSHPHPQVYAMHSHPPPADDGREEMELRVGQPTIPATHGEHGTAPREARDEAAETGGGRGGGEEGGDREQSATFQFVDLESGLRRLSQGDGGSGLGQARRSRVLDDEPFCTCEL